MKIGKNRDNDLICARKVFFWRWIPIIITDAEIDNKFDNYDFRDIKSLN